MSGLCHIQIHVNDQHTFFLNEKIITKYSERLEKIIKLQKMIGSSSVIEINGFPGGPVGFELVSRFCYNNGRIKITVSNVSLLYCCSLFLGMAGNLFQQTESFLEGVLFWSWSDMIVSLKSCESIFVHADSCGLVDKFVLALSAKINQNSELSPSPSQSPSSASSSSPSSSLSSPQTPSGFFRFSCSANNNKPNKPCSQSPQSNKAWWFDDLIMLSPLIIEKIIRGLGAFGAENNSLILTTFLLHYLKSSSNNNNQRKCGGYCGLVDTTVHGVISVGKGSFSCRKLFWVLRTVSNFGLSKDCRASMEKMIGGLLDEATLDDLLVSGHGHGHDKSVYDVNLVIRLIRVFVNDNDLRSVKKMKKVGKLIDKYLGEISPDQKLKVSKFLGVAESLPDSARDCFDGVYRAVDVYLESHQSLSSKEILELCRCLNYKKLTLEANKDLAKNPRIPPNITMEALISQHSKLATKENEFPYHQSEPKRQSIDPNTENSRVVLYNSAGASPVDGGDTEESPSEENERMRMNLQRMECKVMELENVCREMKGHMHTLVRQNRTLPRFC